MEVTFTNFVQKSVFIVLPLSLLRNMNFCQKLTIQPVKNLTFWSLDQLVVETLGKSSMSVRTSVRTYVRNAFSRKLFIIFF